MTTKNENPPFINIKPAQTMESSLSDITKQLLNDKKVRQLTAIDRKELEPLSSLAAYQKISGSKVIGNYLLENLLLRVSINRGGRREVVVVAKSYAQGASQDQQAGRLKRWLGFGGGI